MKFPEQFRYNRVPLKYQSDVGDRFGIFVGAYPDIGRNLRMLASDGNITGWDHVSVSIPNQPKRTPSWAEMCWVKSLFWDDEEEVVQFHPKKSQYVNNHPGCLHLWRPVRAQMPTPPRICV